MAKVEQFEEKNGTKHSLVTLDDGTKIIDMVMIPEKKKLRAWIKKHHPEYLADCEANGEFD